MKSNPPHINPAKQDFIAKRFHPPKVDFFRGRRISLKKALAKKASAFFWSWWRGSDPRPADYESAALPLCYTSEPLISITYFFAFCKSFLYNCAKLILIPKRGEKSPFFKGLFSVAFFKSLFFYAPRYALRTRSSSASSRELPNMVITPFSST